MRSAPRQPDNRVNVSKTHPLVEAGTLLIGLTGLFVVATVVLVYFVEIFLAHVSVETETRWFSGWNVQEEAVAADEDPRSAQTRALLQRLVTHWPDTSYEFRLQIEDSEVLNAMALPGGRIIVTSALMDNVETENELAFVLGHELGHFRNRDHIRRYGRAALFVLLFSAVSQGGSGSLFGMKISDFTLLDFGREEETEADQFGLFLVQSEYGHVNASWRFFDRIAELSGQGGLLSNYLATHPQPGRRIDALKNHARANGWPVEGPVRDWTPGATPSRDLVHPAAH